jgi:pyruvate dehydrogenase E2 component (dihydrolipoamide acetyltransferase)
MAFEYELPDIGEGLAEGELVEWHVAPGDEITEGQVLADVETDKAVVDLPAPVDGTVLDLHAEEGEMVPVGSIVATIDVEGEVPDDAEVDVDEAAEEEPATSEATDGTAEATGGDEDAIEAATNEGRVFAPPNVRRLAREEGVDITTVDGSGPSGRITEADVRAAAESATEETEPTTETKSAVASRDESGGTQAAATVETADRERTLAVPATRKVARELGVDIDEVPTDKTRDGEAFVEEEDVRAFAEGETTATTDVESAQPTPGTAATEQPVTTEAYKGIRRTIGQQMEQSKYTAPHVTHHDMVDVSNLVDVREQLKDRADEQGINLTYMPFVIKAIIAGLKEFPMLNSELDEEAEEIIYKEYYNIGIAVATDAGLMVPVVKNADQKGMLQIASEVNELAAKARDRKVSPEEMQDGTFSITNFGAFGGEYATPILNYPETAILGLGAIKQRPVVEETETTESSRNASGAAASTGEVVARHTLPLSLSIDHRVIDGGEAARFVNTVKEHLENPTLLMLE